MRIILASKSPRRKELLELIGVKKFEIMVSDVDEVIEENLSIEDQSKKLAFNKAKAVFDKTEGDRIIIGSDTLVVKNKKIYGKPKTKAEAFSMIKELKNDEHQVITSICVIKEEDGKETTYIDYDITTIYIDNMTDEEIQKWIDSGQAMDKAGAYGIQENFAVHIKNMNGNYYAVMGLPINKLYNEIKQYI